MQRRAPAQAIALAFALSLLACGSETGDGGDSGTGGAGSTTTDTGTGGDDAAGTGGNAPSASTGPEPTGCDNFANWDCEFVEERDECYATCAEEDRTRQLACDGNGHCASTVQGTCEYVGVQLPACGDCEAAFAGGCTGE